MNQDVELKQEFEKLIEDLVKDIMKSVLYEDFQKLYKNYNNVNNNLLDTNKKIQSSNSEFNAVINRLKNSALEVDKSSQFLNENIDDLTQKIEINVRKRLEESVLQNKKNLDSLSEEIKNIKAELIRLTKSNETNINNKMIQTERNIEAINNKLVSKTDSYKAQMEYKIAELNRINKNMGMATIALSAINVILVIFMIMKLGAM